MNNRLKIDSHKQVSKCTSKSISRIFYVAKITRFVQT